MGRRAMSPRSRVTSPRSRVTSPRSRATSPRSLPLELEDEDRDRLRDRLKLRDDRLLKLDPDDDEEDRLRDRLLELLPARLHRNWSCVTHCSSNCEDVMIFVNIYFSLTNFAYLTRFSILLFLIKLNSSKLFLKSHALLFIRNLFIRIGDVYSSVYHSFQYK